MKRAKVKGGVERIPSHEAYQWMVDFVDEIVAPADENAAEK
jgi:hypothetical protein